jgi:hypothetical protein
MRPSDPGFDGSMNAHGGIIRIPDIALGDLERSFIRKSAECNPIWKNSTPLLLALAVRNVHFQREILRSKRLPHGNVGSLDQLCKGDALLSGRRPAGPDPVKVENIVFWLLR